MHLSKKIIFYAILTIVYLSSLSGCILEDLLVGTNFSLTSWEIYDDEGFPGLSLIFSSTGTVTIKIFGPDDTVLDSDLLFYGSDNVFLHLAPYRETVTSGQYKLRAYDKNNNEIFEKMFSFDGPDLSISSCDQKWWKQEVWKDDYSLIGLTMLTYNNGDVPAYLYNAKIDVDSKSYSCLILPSVVLPGENKYVDCFIYSEDISEDATFSVLLKDSLGETTGNGSFSVAIEDNVPTEEYKWRYEGRNRRISIPYPNFLYSHYSSIDRARLEDYSVYVFDLYDDNYIDLLVDRLMHSSNMESDVDKINFATSFVQNLEYKKDSETNESFEYPRYPIETIFNGDGGGDCEDKAILTASILDKMGYDVALFRLTNHMAVGVSLDENIPNYEYYADNYYFLETTTKNQKLGYMPKEYKSDSNLTVYPISSRPLLIHKWKNNSITIFKETYLGDFVKVTLFVENIGSTTAENILVKAGFYTQDNLELNAGIEIIPSLKPGMKEKITLTADIPSDVTTWFKTRIYLENDIVDEKESASSFP